MHIAEPQVSGCQFALEGGIARRLACQAVEIVHRRFDQETAALLSPRQIPDGVVNVEYQRVGQSAYIVEPAFGARPFDPDDVRLPTHCDGSADQQQNEEHRGCYRKRVAPDEFPKPVTEGILARKDRQAHQVAAYVLRELLHGGVAPRGILVQGPFENTIQISTNPSIVAAAIASLRALARASHDLARRQQP